MLENNLYETIREIASPVDVYSEDIMNEIIRLNEEVKKEKMEQNEIQYKRFTLDYTSPEGVKIIFGAFDLIGKNVILKKEETPRILKSMVPIESSPEDFFIFGGVNIDYIDDEFYKKFNWVKRPVIAILTKDYYKKILKENNLTDNESALSVINDALNMGFTLYNDEFYYAYTYMYEGTPLHMNSKKKYELHQKKKEETSDRVSDYGKKLNMFSLIKNQLKSGISFYRVLGCNKRDDQTYFAFVDSIGVNVKSKNYLLKPFLNKRKDEIDRNSYIITDDYEWLEKSKNMVPRNASKDGKGRWVECGKCFAYLQKNTFTNYCNNFDIESLEMFNKIIHINYEEYDEDTLIALSTLYRYDEEK